MTARRTALWIGVAVVLAAAALTWLLWPAGSALEMPPGQSLEAAQLESLAKLPAFRLERAGAPLTDAELRGHWQFLFFGYTNCPNACPATLGLLGHVQEALRAQGIDPPRVVFVSLDPDRDTPQLLERYASGFGPAMTGATGAEQALRSLLAFFGVTWERNASSDPANYTIDHTTSFFLVTPDLRWLATFPSSEDPDAVLEDTRRLLALPLR